MLTPVEEAGLAGQRLAARIRRALYRMTDADLSALMHSIDDAARARKLFYLRDDEVDVIRLLPMPVAALPDQLSYVRTVTLALHGALARLPDLYFEDPDVHDLLELPEEEEAWLRAYWKPHVREHNVLFGRHDAVVDFRLAAWKSSFQFIEPNLSGIGGLHMIPTAEQILGELVLPILHANDPNLKLEIPTDIRDLLMQELVDHLESIGRAGDATICFIEPKYEGHGPDEQGELARHFAERFGLSVFHADPSELELHGDQVCYQGRAIDLAYRDYSVGDLLEIGEEGVDVAPMRALFAQNRIVSSIAAELDQKSMFEVLGDPYLSARHFSGADRNLFQRHIPWTRLLTDREASLPGGASGDLLEYVSRMREQLVIKPNRDYGGTGVLIGAVATETQWREGLDAAVADDERWVLQQVVELPVLEFPVIAPDNTVQAESFYTVMGFAASRYGLASLGRASQRRVVNVAQRGGMVVLVVGQPPGPLDL